MYSILKGNLLGIAILFIIHAGRTQSFINYSISQGMPSNEVYDIYQDKEGFLWFATDNGVVRYDGQELKILHTKDGLSDPVVFSFYEDYKKRLWFKTYSGRLSYYDPHSKKISPYAFNDSLASMLRSGLLYSLYIDRLNNIWLSKGINLAKIDGNGKITTTQLPLKSFSYQEVDSVPLLGFNPKDLVIDKAFINNTGYPIHLTKTDIQNHVVCSAYIEGKLYFSMGIDLFQYANNKIKKVVSGRSAIISLSRDNANSLWIGYLNGGVDILKSSSDAIELFPLFKDQSITRVLSNQDGSYWFSTLEHGIYYVPNLTIRVSSYLKDVKIKCVLYANQTMIIGDQKGYLHFFDPEKKEETSSFYAGGTILSLFKDEENKVWVSTNSEVLIFNPENQLIKRMGQLSKIDFSGDKRHRVWGTGSLTTLFNLRGDILSEYNTGAYRSVLAVDSFLILAGKLGIELREQNSFDMSYVPAALRTAKVRKIDFLNDTTLLLSSIGGGPILLCSNKESPQGWIIGSKKIKADNIYAAAIKDSNLWLGTENGLFSIDMNSSLMKDGSYKQLTKESGLLNNKIDFIIITAHDVWAFSDDGITILADTIFNTPQPDPKFYIKGVFVNNLEIQQPQEQGLTLSPDENYLRIDFGFISFHNQHISLRFRLSEQHDWSYTTNRSIEFFALNPDKYKLVLEYSTDELEWNSAIHDLSIYVKPPWWKVGYVQLTFALLVMVLIFIYVRNRISLITQRQVYLQSIADHQDLLIKSEIESVEKERSRIVKDLHDGVGTSMVTLKMMVSKLIPQENNLREIVDTHFQDTLEELRTVIYDISPPGLERYGLLTGLRNYIDRVNLLLATKVELNLFGDEINDKQVKQVVFRIIQELLTNALKHSKANKIIIHINSFKDILNVIFEDNGIGITHLPSSNGMGLSSIEYRIKLLGGVYALESSTSGTSFIIDIPQPNANDPYRAN